MKLKFVASSLQTAVSVHTLDVWALFGRLLLFPSNFFMSLNGALSNFFALLFDFFFLPSPGWLPPLPQAEMGVLGTASSSSSPLVGMALSASEGWAVEVSVVGVSVMGVSVVISFVSSVVTEVMDRLPSTPVHARNNALIWLHKYRMMRLGR